MVGALGNAEYSFAAIASRSTLVQSGKHLIRVLSVGQIELNRGFKRLPFLHANCVFMSNRISRNRTVLTCKLRTELFETANLNCLK